MNKKHRVIKISLKTSQAHYNLTQSGYFEKVDEVEVRLIHKSLIIYATGYKML